MTKILFLCVANSARSQMAEALAKSLLSSTIDVKSAGSQPGSRVHPAAVESLKEVGIDISSAIPKAISNLPSDFLTSDCLIVRLCAEEQCPIVSNSSVIDWNLADPASVEADQQKLTFSQTRETLTKLIRQLELNHLGEENI